MIALCMNRFQIQYFKRMLVKHEVTSCMLIAGLFILIRTNFLQKQEYMCFTILTKKSCLTYQKQEWNAKIW